MNATGRGGFRSSGFQGRGNARTPRGVRCSSSRWTLPPAEPFPGVGRLLNRKDNSFEFRPASPDSLTLPSTARPDRLTHVQVPFTWNLSPLRPSKFSFEYLLLPPRSAPAALRRARALGFAATARPPTHRGLALARRRRAVGHRNPASVHPASPVLLTKNGPLGALDSVGWLNKAATRPTYLKFENRSRALRPDASNHWLYR
ncbi:hypothetical protein Bca4012_102912 [Brassica carinata]